MAQDSKKIQALEGLEKKAKRRIMQGRMEEAIDDLRYIIAQYRELKMFERANVLEMTLNQFISETPTAQSSTPTAVQISTPANQDEPERKGKQGFLEFLHKE